MRVHTHQQSNGLHALDLRDLTEEQKADVCGLISAYERFPQTRRSGPFLQLIENTDQWDEVVLWEK